MSTPTKETPPQPYQPLTIPHLVARWLNDQRPRPAGTIAKLALLSKSHYHQIVPILYTTLILGGQHDHHCLQIPYASSIHETIGTNRMARGGIEDGTFFMIDNHWYNTTRRLHNLTLVRTIYLTGPLPTLLSCDIVSRLDFNVFPLAKCVIFGPGVIDAISSIPHNVLGVKLDPPYKGISKGPFVKSLNRYRPVWLSAFVAITRPRTLHVHYRQVAYEDFRSKPHGETCDCCKFVNRLRYLGPPHQWTSLRTFTAHGIVDHTIPLVLNCSNIINFSSHLRIASKSVSPGSASSTVAPVEFETLVNAKDPNWPPVRLPGLMWEGRIQQLVQTIAITRLHLGRKNFARKAYNRVLPEKFRVKFYNFLGHIEIENEHCLPNRTKVNRAFLKSAEESRQWQISHSPDMEDVMPGTTSLPFKIRFRTWEPKCDSNHLTRLW